VPHYLIVDRRDRSAFIHLERGRRRLVESEALIGNWMWRMPSRKSFWLSLKAPPVRGWIVQQILKIGAIEAIPERILVFCDSDTAFIRHFDRDDLLVDGKVGLLDVPFCDDAVRRWTAAARRLLGLAQHDGGYRNHVGNMICWNRETVKAMQQRIETSTGMNWQVALARTPSVAEYIIYGTFVREVLGYDAVDHAPLDGSASQGVVGRGANHRRGNRRLLHQFRSTNGGSDGPFQGRHRPGPLPPPSRASLEGRGLRTRIASIEFARIFPDPLDGKTIPMDRTYQCRLSCFIK
jgi:hypothetical protein